MINNSMDKEKNGLNGLDICSIMGINKDRDIFDVYLEKINYTPYAYKKKEINEASYWDLTIKEIIAKEFYLRSGKKVRKENNQLVDEEYAFMIGDIDRRVVGENSILICKSENAFCIPKWNGQELPESYILECQHYLRISKTEKCYIAALIGGKRFVYKEVLRDEYMINMIIQIEKDFWINNVSKKVVPKRENMCTSINYAIKRRV